jgi:hypothetical protein
MARLFNIHVTRSWAVVLHTLESLAISIVIALLAAAEHYLSANGTLINWQNFVTVLAAAFFAAFAKGYPALIPQVEQAVADSTGATSSSPAAITQAIEQTMLRVLPQWAQAMLPALIQQAMQQAAQSSLPLQTGIPTSSASPTTGMAHPQAQPAVLAPLVPAPPPVSVGPTTAQVSAVTGTGNWMNS